MLNGTLEDKESLCVLGTVCTRYAIGLIEGEKLFANTCIPSWEYFFISVLRTFDSPWCYLCS